jgi:sugar lactone lactonase YvrE
MSKATQTLITTLVCTVLAACGGGGGSSDSSTATTTGTTQTSTPATPAGSTTPQNGQSTGDTSGTSTPASSGANGSGSNTGSGTSTGTTGSTTTPGTVPTSPATGSGTPPASGSAGSPSPLTPAATADATQARFNGPTGMKFAANGDLYVADTGNYTVRKIASNGAVTTIAGKTGVQGTADGIGSAALFTEPRGVTVDGTGNIYVTDGSVVRMITPAGVVTTLAGRQGEFGNVDGNGANARFRSPDGIVLDAAGNVFVADSFTYTIRKITPTGDVSTFAGDTGTGTGFDFSGPYGLAIDGAGNLYVADVTNAPGKSPILLRGSSFVRKITPAGVVATLAGNFGHTTATADTAPNAAFSNAAGIAVDAAGNVYVTDHFDGGNGIKRISPNGVVTAMPVTGAGVGLFARLTLDPAGNLFASDSSNNTIDRIAQTGEVAVYAGKSGAAGSADTP